MTGILTSAGAICITLSVLLYSTLMAVLFLKLAIEEAELRRQLVVPLLPAFFQNCGIPVALIGLTFQSTELAAVGTLLIAVGVVTTTDGALALNPVIETPLLVLTSLGVVSLGVIRFVL